MNLLLNYGIFVKNYFAVKMISHLDEIFLTIEMKIIGKDDLIST